MTRDERIGTALRQLPVPEPASDFFDRLTSRLEEEAMGTVVSTTGATAMRRRPPWLAAAAAAAVALAAGVGLGITLQSGREAPVAPAGESVTLSDLAAAVVQAEEVDDLEAVAHFDLPHSPGARVLGAQFLSPVNVQRLEDQTSVVGGARNEYVSPDGRGGLSSLAVLFETEADATRALGFVAAALPDQSDPASGTTPLGSDLREGPLEPVAATGLGDEALGFRGFMDSRYPGTAQTLYVWRDGSVLLAIWGTGLEPQEIRDLAGAMDARLD